MKTKCTQQHEQKEEQKSFFFPLTPTRNAENIEAYRKAMDYALKQADIRNIAITGPYGSGKSSFLRTYFGEDKNVLWISLASFLGVPKEERGRNGTNASGEETEESGNAKEGQDYFGEERRLELSILQQIFYRFSSKKVPYSRLCKTTAISKWWYFWRIAWIVWTFVFFVCAWQPDYLKDFVGKSARYWIANHSIWFFWVGVAGVFVSFCFLAWYVLFWLATNRVRHVDVKGLGISMSDKTERSILNRNIDEIIYHFEVSEYRTVIFEDIDRFDDVDIFTKLREVNLILNNAEQIPSKRKPIRFIYALKEDLFVKKTDKVKFFDFIIPIIPQINASNSQTEVLGFLKGMGDNEGDEALVKCVKDVSPYVSDLRLLRNICNEYRTYKEQIPECTSNQELLGLIVFKNFFPKEFALMHSESGMMRSFMDAKKEAQNKKIEEIEKQIENLKDDIQHIKEEMIPDVQKLQLLYFATLMQQFDHNDQYLSHEGEQLYTLEIIHRPDWFSELRGNQYVRWRYGAPIKWSEIEKKTDPNCTYEEHVKRIEGRKNGRIAEIKRSIQRHRDHQRRIRRQTIQELMAEGVLRDETIAAIAGGCGGDRQDIELVLILLKNGLLNERYYLNISIFHEVDGINSPVDHHFMIQVTRGEEADWTLRLQDPQTLVENFDLQYFAKSSMMNYDICRELLNQPESEKAKELWTMLSHGGQKNNEFVDGYIKASAAEGKKTWLFDCIMEVNPNYMFELLVTYSSEEVWPREFVEYQMGLYIAWALRQEQTTALSPDEKEFLEATASIPRLLRDNGISDVAGMTSFVKDFGLKFKVLDFEQAKETGFLDVVIDQDAYVLEHDFLKGLLHAKGIATADFEKRNFSTIADCGIPQIVGYVSREFKAYLAQIYTRLELQQEDSCKHVASVLNREDLSDEEVAQFVEKQSPQGKIGDAKQLSDKALARCIKLHWLLPSWNNAVEVWCRNKKDKSLFWAYVNDADCHQTLSERNSYGIPWMKAEGWAKQLAESKNLSDEAMNGLLSGMTKGVITGYSGANATPQRIEYLVRGGRIRYSKELYGALRDLDNDSHIVLAARFIKEFCDGYVDGMTELEDVKKLLKSPMLHRRNLPLAINVLKDLVIVSKDLLIDVAGMVNAGNYPQLDEGVLDAILPHVKMESLQCKMIQHLGGRADEIRARLKRMPEPYNKLGELGCHPQLRKWDGVEAFLEFLKGKEIVSSVSEADNGKIQVYTAKS
ncbi:MAG: hypothetical protein IJT88_00665 [Kiritimatiellae bacterium]|nr:hypothetical protein [Kiritimatiellia bacterium]